MSIEALKERMPDYAKDIKLNLSSIVREDILNPQQLWGTLLACAIAGRNIEVITAIEAEAKAHLSAEAMAAAKAASAVMAMNNVYYKFTGMMPAYRDLPAKLRMSIIGNPGVGKVDFELWSLAVSAINGCQFCVQAHEKKLMDEGINTLQIQTAVRIGAVVQAASVVLGSEMALNERELSAVA